MPKQAKVLNYILAFYAISGDEAINEKMVAPQLHTKTLEKTQNNTWSRFQEELAN